MLLFVCVAASADCGAKKELLDFADSFFASTARPPTRNNSGHRASVGKADGVEKEGANCSTCGATLAITPDVALHDANTKLNPVVRSEHMVGFRV